MNLQQAGSSYMDLVNRVMQMANESTPGYALSQADKSLRQRGIGFTDPRYLKDPSMNDAMMDMVIAGSTRAPDKMTPDMINKILKNTGKYHPRVKNVWGDKQGKDILETAIRVLSGNYK